jgi:preprotein translocase subunit SecD
VTCEYKDQAKGVFLPLIVRDPGDSTPITPKCDKPNVVKEGNKFSFDCATPGATFKSRLTPNIEEQEFEGSEMMLQSDAVSYTLTVIASAEGYEDSDPVMMTITIDKSDVNQDGVINPHCS